MSNPNGRGGSDDYPVIWEALVEEWPYDYIGNEDIMINYITQSEYAYEWARWIGNQGIMKSRVTEPYWIDRWNNRFPNDKII